MNETNGGNMTSDTINFVLETLVVAQRALVDCNPYKDWRKSNKHKAAQENRLACDAIREAIDRIKGETQP